MDLKGNLLIYDSSHYILYYLVFTTLHIWRQYIHANEYNILFFSSAKIRKHYFILLLVYKRVTFKS